MLPVSFQCSVSSRLLSLGGGASDATMMIANGFDTAIIVGRGSKSGAADHVRRFEVAVGTIHPFNIF